MHQEAQYIRLQQAYLGMLLSFCCSFVLLQANSFLAQPHIFFRYIKDLVSSDIPSLLFHCEIVSPDKGIYQQL